MSKLANPWKCDACGILRANDTNHWLMIYVSRTLSARVLSGGSPMICVEPWNDAMAEQEGTKHACGIDCGLKIIAQLIVEKFFPAEISSAGKEVANGQQ